MKQWFRVSRAYFTSLYRYITVGRHCGADCFRYEVGAIMGGVLLLLFLPVLGYAYLGTPGAVAVLCGDALAIAKMQRDTNRILGPRKRR